ncbi:MAG: hypothetical protein QF915_02105 [Candidatus Woesearchaeota archaeon]|nr:hypothetical protein [Candidatus Woesearchaeota archaeon]
MTIEGFEDISVEDCKFYNHPIYYPLGKYHEAVELVKKKYKSNNIKSLYLFGAFSSPGISDIDFLIVLNNPKKGVQRVFINKEQRYLIFHPSYIVNEHIAKNLREIYPDIEPILLQGKEIEISELDKKFLDYYLLYLTLDVMIRHFPRDFLEQLFIKKIDVRKSLLRRHAFTHSLVTYHKLTSRKIKVFDRYIKDVNDLRKNWFKIDEGDRKEKLIEMLKQSVTLTYLFIDKLDTHIKSKKILEIKEGGKAVYHGFQNQAFFIQRWNQNSALKKCIDYYDETGKIYSFLPLAFALLPIAYARKGGLIGEHIRRGLETDIVEYTLKGKSVVDSRINLLNEQMEITKVSKHSHFPAFFEYGLKSRYGIINTFLRFLRRIKNSKIYKALKTP